MASCAPIGNRRSKLCTISPLGPVGGAGGFALRSSNVSSTSFNGEDGPAEHIATDKAFFARAVLGQLVFCVQLEGKNIHRSRRSKPSGRTEIGAHATVALDGKNSMARLQRPMRPGGDRTPLELLAQGDPAEIRQLRRAIDRSGIRHAPLMRVWRICQAIYTARSFGRRWADRLVSSQVASLRTSHRLCGAISGSGRSGNVGPCSARARGQGQRNTLVLPRRVLAATVLRESLENPRNRYALYCHPTASSPDFSQGEWQKAVQSGINISADKCL